MRVLITGATGGIGRALSAHLNAQGHEAVPLRRGSAQRPAAGGPSWDPAAGRLEASTLSGFDAVVHLSGANIGDGRWSEARKRVLVAHSGSVKTNTSTAAYGPLDPFGVVGGINFAKEPPARAVRNPLIRATNCASVVSGGTTMLRAAESLPTTLNEGTLKIGRASCRERV